MEEMAESLVSNSLLALKTNTGRCYYGSALAFHGMETPYLQYYKLQFRHIVRVNPVLGRLPHKVLLSTSRRAIPFYWFSPCADDIIQLGQVDYERIVVVTEERLRF